MKRLKWTAALLAVLLAAFSLWYTRPMSIYQLYPGLEVGQINAYTDHVSDGVYTSRELDTTADTAEGQALLAHLESLRFRRSLFNPIRQLLPRRITGGIVEEGAYTYVIYLFDTNPGWLHLQFFVDEWSFSIPGQGGDLP